MSKRGLRFSFSRCWLCIINLFYTQETNETWKYDLLYLKANTLPSNWTDFRSGELNRDHHQGLEGIDLEEGLRLRSAVRAPPRAIFGNQNWPPTPIEKRLREVSYQLITPGNRFQLDSPLFWNLIHLAQIHISFYLICSSKMKHITYWCPSLKSLMVINGIIKIQELKWLIDNA